VSIQSNAVDAPDEVGKEVGEAQLAARDPTAHEAIGEGGVVRCHPQVACCRNGEATADGVAVDRCDDRDGQSVDGPDDGGQLVVQVLELGLYGIG
jgi:hypothetical protein